MLPIDQVFRFLGQMLYIDSVGCWVGSSLWGLLRCREASSLTSPRPAQQPVCLCVGGVVTHVSGECRHVTVGHHVPDCSSVVQTCTAALQIGRLPCCSAGHDTSKLYTRWSIETIDQPWLGTFCIIKDRKDSQKSNNLQPSLDRLESFLCGWREHCTSSRLHLRPVQTRHVF